VTISPLTRGVIPHRPSIPHTTSVHCLSFRTRFYALSGGIASRDSEFDVLILGRGASLLRVSVIEAGQYLPEDPLINVPTAGNLLGNYNVRTLIGNPTYDWCLESMPQVGLDGLVIQYFR
jgi:hypothetical protein